MGFRVVNERTYRVEPPADGEPGPLAARHAARACRRPSDRPRRRSSSGSKPAFLVVMRGRAENDGYNALVLEAGLPWRDVALDPHDLALPAPGAGALFAGLHVGDAAQACGDRDRDRRAVPRPLRSAPRGLARPARRARGRDPGAHRGGAAAASTASTRTASCGASSTRSRRRCAPISTRSTRTVSRRARSPSSSRAAASTRCRCRDRCTRSSSIRRASKACTCGSARSRAAACAGPTGRRTSAPRCSGWSRRSR